MDDIRLAAAAGGVLVPNPLALPDNGWDLLWENANPSANFNSQTIDIPDLNKYSVLYLEWARGITASYQNEINSILVRNVSGAKFILTWSGVDGSKPAVYRRRNNRISDTGISIDTAQVCTSTSYKDDNQWGIPKRLYGYKGD